MFMKNNNRKYVVERGCVVYIPTLPLLSSNYAQYAKTLHLQENCVYQLEEEWQQSPGDDKLNVWKASYMLAFQLCFLFLLSH